jgi:hypothetical protein
MIDKLHVSTGEQGKKAIAVIDAGIATEANLQMITAKGYDYVCVSCSHLKKYSVVQDASPVKVTDNKNYRQQFKFRRSRTSIQRRHTVYIGFWYRIYH